MSITGVVSEALPDWGVIYLSEVDAGRGDCNARNIFGHTVHRHWPGIGCSSMQFTIRRRFRHLARNVTWKGRCGALHLFNRNTGSGKNFNLYIIGVHNSHGEEQIDTLSDISHLLRHRPWGCKVLLVGDWNVDQLPTLANDPYRDH